MVPLKHWPQCTAEELTTSNPFSWQLPLLHRHNVWDYIIYYRISMSFLVRTKKNLPVQRKDMQGISQIHGGFLLNHSGKAVINLKTHETIY